MKYTVEGFQQEELLSLGFDCSDVVMLRWLIDFTHDGKMLTKIIDNRIYYWVRYQSIIDDLPLLGITNTEIIARRFTKWEKVGFIIKHLVKGKDDYFCNGRTGSRTGTYTYFAFDSEKLGRLMRDLPKSRALTEAKAQGVYSKVDPGSTKKKRRGLPESRTKDSSIIDYTIKDSSINDNNMKKNYFTWEEWNFLATGNALNTITGKEYPVRKLPFPVPIELCMKIDDYYCEYKRKESG